ncbi:MAG: NAD-dependent epimerase/dehydratase family protein [Candidatus Lokiarchaeota archaeon]|nr:NAD-dependent epimerase/dehydratase family protein [Candidatus Lokiarchaeota archaeon]
MNILVTGGCGFIGSNLVDFLIKDNKKNNILIIDDIKRDGAKLNKRWLENLYGERKNFRIVIKDIKNNNDIKSFFKDQEMIFHIAGQVAVTTSVKDPVMDFKINAGGTLNILEAARKSNTNPVILFTSTNKVYGNLNQYQIKLKDKKYDFKDLTGGVNESTPLDFHSPYGCSKGAADSYMKDYYRIYGLKTILFRMSCIYGPRQFGNEDQGWVAHFIISSILDKALTIFGDGKQVRDILFIDDLVKAMLQATDNINKTKGKVYNIGGGPKNVISLLELLELLEKHLNKKINVSYEDWRPGDQKVYYSNIDKAKEDFGWSPIITKEKGIVKLINWVKQNKILIKKRIL